MRQPDNQSTSVLADRGVGWQASGFTLTGIACLWILKAFDGSDYWLYQWFETAAVDLYWAFVLPLAVLFDGGRKLFEKGKAIRDAQKAKIESRALEKGRREGEEIGRREGEEEGRLAEQERIQKALEKHGVALSPDVVDDLFGNASGGSS